MASMTSSDPTMTAVRPGTVVLESVSISRRGNLLISDLDLSIERGGALAIVGPSGAGKTTLVRAIAGLTPITSGTVTKGEGRISMVFQDARLLPWRTALENIELVLDRGARDKAMEWLERVGLADAAHVHPASLSGGMRQRVAIARALAVDAPLVLVDEPFAHLDGVTAGALRQDLLGHLRVTDSTVIWITHDTAEADAVADRVLIMDGPPSGEWRIEPTSKPTDPPTRNGRNS